MGCCPNCGGTMLGDGFTVVRHCENTADVSDIEPDANPVYCDEDKSEKTIMEYDKDNGIGVGACGGKAVADLATALVNAQAAVKKSEERAHHEYSPSSLQSLEACPCYRGRESKHERTIAGTIAHGVAESGQDDNRLGDDDAEAAAECLDFVHQRRILFDEARNRAVMLLSCGKNGEALVPQVLEVKEIYLPIDDIETVEDWFDRDLKLSTRHTVKGTSAGYIDHGFISHDRTYAEIFDWKFGLWPVEAADNNLQGFAYILGIFKKFPTVERVKFFFKQPHINEVSEVTKTRHDIAEIYLRIQVVVERSRRARKSGSFDDATPRIPNCNFCANIGKCPKVGAFACKVAHKFFPLEIPDNITPTMLHESRDITIGMRLASVLSVWCDSFRAQKTDQVIRGAADIPDGFTIQSRSNREIVSSEAFRKVALQFLTEEEYLSATDAPGFGKLEKIIIDKTPRGQKKGRVIEFNAALETGGATAKGQPYSFLKAVAAKKENSETGNTATQKA